MLDRIMGYLGYIDRRKFRKVTHTLLKQNGRLAEESFRVDVLNTIAMEMSDLVIEAVNLLGEVGPGFDDPRVQEIYGKISEIQHGAKAKVQDQHDAFRKEQQKE